MKGADFFHNHPDAPHYALSLEDIYVAVKNEFKSISAIGADGRTYTARPTKDTQFDFATKKKFEEYWYDVQDKIFKIAKEEMNSKEFDEFFNSITHHTNIAVCHKLGIKYTPTK